jgi:hypothetical protein
LGEIGLVISCGGCRKHVIACPELMLKAVSGQDGVSSLKLVVRYLAMR